MLKVFGSYLPEYQIMLVCFFIFLTVLYMVLVICEGTWERQRRAMLQDSALLIVIFLITSGLCVRSRVFGGEQDTMILFKIPYAFLFIMGICGYLFAGIQMFGIFKRRRNYLRENAFSCYMSMPEKPSGNFCILEKTGDSPDEGIYTATLAVQSYGSSDFSAAQLSHFVVQAMLDADTLPEIVSCDLVTEYNFPDTTRKRPRYQAVFSITHY